MPRLAQRITMQVIDMTDFRALACQAVQDPVVWHVALDWLEERVGNLYALYGKDFSSFQHAHI